ncbi:MAG TPA: SpoIIE family protein phosphatase [Pyrinomonadaceae bacterium]|nr:SpoIIE family protein phosphatase [Pyrinomonadaceae bacterium]
MVTAIEPLIREQLLDRRQKLEVAAIGYRQDDELTRLLREVDTALQRMDDGTYGICDVCHEPVESERLIADPLTRLCIDHLSPHEQRALEDDLELAGRIQTGLLPQPSQKIDGWEIAYHYQPAGVVSGDYCDVISDGNQNVLFVLGDVSGKGVAASMLMAHLQAMFRTLISVGLPLEQMIERASRVFCESTLPTHYATLVCGKTNPSGLVEVCNAGHLPPLLFQAGTVRQIDATGLPMGIFCNEHFTVNRMQLERGDTLLLYTDGFSEATNAGGMEYGVERLARLFSQYHDLPPHALLDACMRDWLSFGNGPRTKDDVTLMAIQRTH